MFHGSDSGVGYYSEWSDGSCHIMIVRHGSGVQKISGGATLSFQVQLVKPATPTQSRLTRNFHKVNNHEKLKWWLRVRKKYVVEKGNQKVFQVVEKGN